MAQSHEHNCIYKDFLQKVFLAAGEIAATEDKLRVYFLGSSQNYSEKELCFSEMLEKLRTRLINDPEGVAKITASNISLIFGSSTNQRSYSFSAETAPKLVKRYVLTLYRIYSERTILFTLSESDITEGILTYMSKRNCINQIIADIYYVGYGNHCVEIHDGEKITKTFSISFSDVADTLLRHGGFVRSYKNCIINMSKIQRIEGDTFILLSGDVIPIPKRRLKEIKNTYAEYKLMENH